MDGLSDEMQAEIDALLHGEPKVDFSTVMAGIQEIFARNGSKNARNRQMMARISESLTARERALAELRADGSLADVCMLCGQAVVGMDDAWCDSKGSTLCGGFGFQVHVVRNQGGFL